MVKLYSIFFYQSHFLSKRKNEFGRVTLRYSLHGHSCHRLQVAVSRCGEVVLVAAHVHGVQPLSHRVEGGEGGEGPLR